MLSRRAAALPPSETLALAAKAKELRAKGRPVIDLTAGEPDFASPDAALRAAQAGIDAKDTHYPPNAGTKELREAVAFRVEKDHGVKIDPARVLVSNGAKQSLYNVIQAIVDEGDEVLLPSPYWVSYPAMIALAQGKTVLLPTRAEEAFRLAPEAVERSITKRTKALILNSPSNPTGAVYRPEDVSAIVRIALDRDIYVVSDEIYSQLVFLGARHRSALEVAHERSGERLIYVSGVSKTYAMTGFRIGYAYGPKDVIDAAARLQSHSTSGACTLAQRAATGALREGDDDARRFRDEFERRLKAAVEGLSAIKGVRVPEPRGAFYVFPDVSAFFGREVAGEKIAGSGDFARVLLEKADVALVPGAAFGADAHVRISYALELAALREAISRIARFLK